MTSLQQTCASLRQDDGDHVIAAPEAWMQGRTLYGGITAALAYSAARDDCGDLGPLRSAQFTFVGPATGELRFRPALLRRGRSSAIVGVDCHNADGITTRGVFVFGGARASVVAHDLTPRVDVPPPEACERFHKTSKPLPGFLANFEFRLAGGARLFEPDKRPELIVWVRFVEGGGDDRIASLLAVADALPGAAMVSFPKPAPISTMTWGVDLHQPLVGVDGWHLVCSTSESAADGYSLQTMRVYNQAGEPLLSGRQVVALFI
jgi:acyl-CoA thioesterase